MPPKVTREPSTQCVINEINLMTERVEDLQYPADGIVVKVNSTKTQNHLGTRSRTPRWAIAKKFDSIRKETKLTEIKHNVGRTGVVKPYAVLERVNINGASIQRATLHNESFILSKDIRIGDYVLVERAGDVIPKIIKPLKKLRTGQEKKYSFPSVCPECHTGLVSDGEDYYCPNSQCPAQLIRSVNHFASRNAMNIVGLGDSLSERLVRNGLVENLADLYSLSISDLEVMEGMGRKSGSNIYSEIQGSKNCELYRLIYGLGIRHVGISLARDIVQHITSFQELQNISLKNIPGIGDAVSESIKQWLDITTNQDLIDDLIDAGVNTKRMPHELHDGSGLNGMTFVLTGSFDKPRNTVASYIASEGGRVTSSVSGNTDYLVVGKKPGGQKVADANRHGVSQISHSNLMKL